MCTEGKPVPAPKAQKAGILDAIVDGNDGSALLTGAIAFAAARAAAHDIRRTRDIPISHEKSRAGLDACDKARAAIAKVGKGSGAPFAAVTAIEAALTVPFDAGSVHERELFADCVVSIESKALRHMFFAEREAAKVAGVPKETPVLDIRRAAVVGAGTMGGGIAMSYANAGIPVLLKEVDDAALQRGLGTIRKNYESSVARGRMTREAVEKTMALITPTTSYDAFNTADIVVEAVFENMDLKKATFAELGRVTRADCVLATNTSTLDIDEFARASGRPGQVIGHHFFSPANIMKLVEIVRGRETSTVGDCDVGEAWQAPRQSARRRRQLLRVRRESDARLLHAGGVSAARRGSERPADRSRAHDVRHAGRPLRHAGHRRDRRRRPHPAVPRIRLARPAQRDRSRRCRIDCSRWAATARRPAQAGIATSPAAASALPTR